ncbi:hypothetical protein [Pseudomonas chlororaphis]|uniref:Integrase n=1 Tax=Pseudomonas chlororaphis O6 TaxID=1037915 RepID=A0AB33WVM7_9PSED|nr:hypothetical protein [Pseudomonas chlororaphis]EIM17001.1 hypothetical protein PchlO6_6053 [Pseudomonas chlororaphis O6]
MSQNTALAGLNIDSPLAIPEALNFKPPTWPPQKDFPVVIDANNQVISRYADSIWDLTPWGKKITKINFGDGPLRRDDPGITPQNSDVYRQIVAWWLYGPKCVHKASGIKQRFEVLRPLFIICSQQQIVATDLIRHPHIISLIAKKIAPSIINHTIALLHDIWEQREAVGFFLLDADNLRKIAGSLPPHHTSQTAYIPPRIWLYQLNRLQTCLEDFNNHRDKIEECFKFCLDAHVTNAGSLTQACSESLPSNRRPFHRCKRLNGIRTGAQFHGPFSKTAEKFGIHELLKRWLTDPDDDGGSALATYFSFIGYVGTAYILNFSLMRVAEGMSLRSDCLIIEHDELTDEDIYILKGATTKTVDDDDARWIASPSVKVAIEAMSTIAKLRIITASANKKVPTTSEDIKNPYLLLRPYEPWKRKSDYLSQPLTVRPVIPSYSLMARKYPKLFNIESLRITAADLDAALLITPTLNPKLFDIGKVWPLSWHQLRRTGAVNMTACGVTEASVQYQLKHATRAMTRYYGIGHYNVRVKFNESARSEYIRTTYEMIAREFESLQSSRFVSPHGEKRKEQIINSVNITDHKLLTAAAKAGRIAYREILPGVCTNPDPCPYGGIDHVSRCGEEMESRHVI